MVVILTGTRKFRASSFNLYLILLLLTVSFTASFGIYQALHGLSRQFPFFTIVAQSSHHESLDAPLQPANSGNHDDFPFLLQTAGSNKSIFSALLDSIDVMQSHFFEVWQGTWPQAIDWTAAVMGTQVSATLSAVSRFEEYELASIETEKGRITFHPMYDLIENLINRYFTQITSFYFGENAFELRMQAFDDMLWVVLGWLEAIRFINQHSRLRKTHAIPNNLTNHSMKATWYGQQFAPQFAHRARIFYDLASKGWNTTLCGGGMIWSPYLAPYKNAITNQLFITASISMYLYFPGDNNPSPFQVDHSHERTESFPQAKPHDSKYLDAAIGAYEWLKSSNMTNDKGLYVDGFHISGWRGGKNSSIGSGKCDIRDEMVYTYNQGVLLSGLRGLWEATSVPDYLDDGHKLIRSVIAATGWHDRGSKNRWEWAGIGRNGVLEDACDSSGSCNQDGQTFKGIFFYHIASFCVPLDEEELEDGLKCKASRPGIAESHRARCNDYIPWVRFNANAAYFTRDLQGRFGSWWGSSLQPHPNTVKQALYDHPNEKLDHMNLGIPKNNVWRLPYDCTSCDTETLQSIERDLRHATSVGRTWDPNDRGRGRTVETQSGGVAVLRALWQMEGIKGHS